MRLAISLFLLGFSISPVHAEIVSSDDDGFIIHHQSALTGDTSSVFESMTGRLGQWWNPDHSFSGDAGNMRLDSSCFCERWDDNLVRHLDTEIWIQNSKVVMAGGLGPLKELGLSGTMIWTVSPLGATGTTVDWKYHVYGNSESDMPMLAAAVDGVLAEQIGRLAEYLNSTTDNKE